MPRPARPQPAVLLLWKPRHSAGGSREAIRPSPARRGFGREPMSSSVQPLLDSARDLSKQTPVRAKGNKTTCRSATLQTIPGKGTNHTLQPRANCEIRGRCDSARNGRKTSALPRGRKARPVSWSAGARHRILLKTEVALTSPTIGSDLVYVRSHFRIVKGRRIRVREYRRPRVRKCNKTDDMF